MRCGAGLGPAPLTIPAMEVNWIGLVLVVLGLYLAFKLIGALFKLLMWLVVLLGAYWFLAPVLGWPTLSDLVYVFGPDFEGQRIEEVFTPERISDGIGGRVVDGVVERVQLPELAGLAELAGTREAVPEEAAAGAGPEYDPDALEQESGQGAPAD